MTSGLVGGPGFPRARAEARKWREAPQNTRRFFSFGLPVALAGLRSGWAFFSSLTNACGFVDEPHSPRSGAARAAVHRKSSVEVATAVNVVQAKNGELGGPHADGWLKASGGGPEFRAPVAGSSLGPRSASSPPPPPLVFREEYAASTRLPA